MTLFDLVKNEAGTVKSIATVETDTHRRLVDMGLIGAEFTVRFKRKRSTLVDFGCSFAAVLEADIANQIEVYNIRHENSALRKP